MKRLRQFTVAVAMVAAVSACSRDPRPDADTTGAVGTSGTTNADREFVAEQLELGTAEIQLGQLAEQRARHADVKEFAAMMVHEHQMAATALKPIAAKLDAAAETETRKDERNDRQDKIEDLSKLSGHDFDRKYMDLMVDDHKDGIDDLETKAENAASPEVKEWAAKTLPKMREHLERAKDIQSRLTTNDAPVGTADRK